MRITDVRGRSVLNSEGSLVLEVEVESGHSFRAHASAPQGTTVGRHDPSAIGVDGALRELARVRRVLLGRVVTDQREIDQQLLRLFPGRGDRTSATDLTTSVSLSVAMCAARATGMPLWRYVATLSGRTPQLPGLVVNFINGGAHAHTATEVTEAMLVTPPRRDPSEAIRTLSAVHARLRDQILRSYGPDAVHSGLEGGFTPSVPTTAELLELLDRAIGDLPDIGVGLDLAANRLKVRSGHYRLDGRIRSASEALADWHELARLHPRLQYLEDLFGDDDDEAWEQQRQDPPVPLCVADDYLSTSAERAQRLRARGSLPSAAVLKIDQAGTLSGLLACADALEECCFVVSQRSRETDGSALPHLAVGLGGQYLKAGCIARERIVKYNELLRIARVVGGGDARRMALV